MTQQTNPPPMRIPASLIRGPKGVIDPELEAFFRRSTKSLYFVWNKAGQQGVLAIQDGGTGADNAPDARVNLGLEIGVDVQAWDAGLESIADLVTVADNMIYTTAFDTYAVAVLTAAGRALLDDETAADQRTTLDVYSKAEVDDISVDDRRYALLVG